jgi:hypothetical protein
VFAGVLAAARRDDREHALRRACAAGALATLVAGADDCAPQDEAISDALARLSNRSIRVIRERPDRCNQQDQQRKSA